MTVRAYDEHRTWKFPTPSTPPVPNGDDCPLLVDPYEPVVVQDTSRRSTVRQTPDEIINPKHMIDEFGSIDSNASHDQNLADWAQDSASGTVTEFSDLHFHNDGTYGFDSYEHDATGDQIGRTDGHQIDPAGQRSLQDYGIDQQPLIGGKLDQQGQNQFGGVDSFQQDLNQF